jgi:hypothetical protein
LVRCKFVECKPGEKREKPGEFCSSCVADVSGGHVTAQQRQGDLQNPRSIITTRTVVVIDARSTKCVPQAMLRRKFLEDAALSGSICVINQFCKESSKT